MQNDKLTNQTIALAALAQSTQLVSQLALTGHCDEHDFEVCIESLFCIDAPTTLSIYGDLPALKSGLKIIASDKKKLLAKDDFFEILEATFRLARNILRSETLKKKLTTHLARLVSQKQYFGSTQHAQVIENLSALYMELAAHCKLYLKLHGRQQAMQNMQVVLRIRVMLLAALRAAILWYQVGGNMLMLLFRRRTYRKQAQQLLQEI